ncbi:hypothetical protein A6R68_22989, partial [Neotoma lepida]
SPRADPGGSRAEVRRRARGSKASEEKGEAGALPGRPGPPRAALTWGGGGGRGLRDFPPVRDGASAGARSRYIPKVKLASSPQRHLLPLLAAPGLVLKEFFRLLTTPALSPGHLLLASF